MGRSHLSKRMHHQGDPKAADKHPACYSQKLEQAYDSSEATWSERLYAQEQPNLLLLLTPCWAWTASSKVVPAPGKGSLPRTAHPPAKLQQVPMPSCSPCKGRAGSSETLQTRFANRARYNCMGKTKGQRIAVLRARVIFKRKLCHKQQNLTTTLKFNTLNPISLPVETSSAISSVCCLDRTVKALLGSTRHAESSDLSALKTRSGKSSTSSLRLSMKELFPLFPYSKGKPSEFQYRMKERKEKTSSRLYG